ncbi:MULTISPECIES: NAD(P)-binding domain-containing protein [unclassified Microbacterium]|uniref:NADPH-dependent F420 reductase n=1 Tax=unclassified Microbacterium TaxID=2609290 RepID=UPI00214C8361|nr:MULTISPECIES: NAD(P)-binding domain-containing protein [unclassified Microbacterium]MCR2784776.1 NAD(P)-binding domain-containing protein [Microbacterium sp. zg.B96]WIM16315.1 NAD(P)-binding domain-containing protein [Microbacterium sp. zg-B96]
MRAADERRAGASGIRRIAILGAGRVGTALARALVDAGYDVTISGSGDPALVEIIVSVVAPGARAAWAEESVSDADMVILALPLHRIKTVDATMLEGRLVVDAMNYWPPVDGQIAEFDGAVDGTSSVVQALLPGARVVKSFNHTGYHDLEPDRRPSRHPDRRAIAVAGDDVRDVAMVAQVIERIGYDAVQVDSLAAGRLLEPGEAPFGARLDAGALTDAAHGAPLVHASPN